MTTKTGVHSPPPSRALRCFRVESEIQNKINMNSRTATGNLICWGEYEILPREGGSTDGQPAPKHVHNLRSNSLSRSTSAPSASRNLSRSMKKTTNLVKFEQTFMGRSKPDEEVWRHTPRSEDPAESRLSERASWRTSVDFLKIMHGDSFFTQ